MFTKYDVFSNFLNVYEINFDLFLITWNYHCEFHCSLVVNTVISTSWYSFSVLVTSVTIMATCLHVSVTSGIVGLLQG